MNKILRKASILFLISFSLIGCTDLTKKRLKELESKYVIKHWIKGDVQFHYEHLTGMDNSGPVYFVFDFSINNEEFLAQFNNNMGEEPSLKQGPDMTFETNTNEFVQKWIGSAYYSWDEEFQINFEKPYSYYRSGEADSGITFGFVYYTETDIVNLFYIKM